MESLSFGEGDLRPRRSKRIQLQSKKPEPRPEASGRNKKEHDVKGKGGSGLKSFGPGVKDWLEGDRGAGVYGVPVSKWGGEEAKETSIQANKIFDKMKPAKQKRRDRYDEEYDMGKVKKVKVKNKGGRKRLGTQNSAFQRAAKGKFDARARRR